VRARSGDPRRPERRELNLYISGYDGEGPAQAAGNGPAMVATGTSPTRATRPDLSASQAVEGR